MNLLPVLKHIKTVMLSMKYDMLSVKKCLLAIRIIFFIMQYICKIDALSIHYEN